MLITLVLGVFINISPFNWDKVFFWTSVLTLCLNLSLSSEFIDFVIKPVAGVNKTEALTKAIERLSDKFSEGFFIAEQLYISDIYSELKKVDGILDVLKVKITNKTGASYSSIVYDINKNLSPDGSYLIAPLNGIFEIKYPATDIKGKVR